MATDNIILYYIILYDVMLCYTMLCYVILYYIILYYIISYYLRVLVVAVRAPRARLLVLVQERVQDDDDGLTCIHNIRMCVYIRIYIYIEIDR